MQRALAPGLYQVPAEPQRAVRELVRADVPVFLGYTARGPLGWPLRLRTLSQFDTLFGAGPGVLRAGVKGFFENGGDALYVLRIASPTARAAGTDLPTSGALTWRAEASFSYAMIDPRRLEGAALPGAQPWISLYEKIIRETGARVPDAGSWANQLSLTLRPAALGRTETVPVELSDDGARIMVQNLAGLSVGSILTLTQSDGSGASQSHTLRLAEIDAPRLMLTVDSALPDLGFDLTKPIQIESVEFDIDIHDAGKLIESHTGLSLAPDHPRAIGQVLAAGSQVMTLTPSDGALSPTDPDHWPLPGTYALSGGTDGLADLERSDYEAALARVSDIPEAALINAPDLTLQPDSRQFDPAPAPTLTDCTDLTPPPENLINGRVLTVNDAGEDIPLAAVQIDPAGRGAAALSGADGRFMLTGLDEGINTLRLTKPGYEDLEFLTQSAAFASSAPVDIRLQATRGARIFGESDVLSLQAQMANPAIVGPYKVALLDAPSPEMDLEQLLTWRTRLADLPRAALIAPWLTLPGTQTAVPASCHLAGLTAAAERAIGVHRSGANMALRYVEGLTNSFDDTRHGVLNDAGITLMRARPGQGIRAMGARSLAADTSLTYLSTRRILDTLERSLERALQPIVFEPNTIFTRQALTLTATALLTLLWKKGALQGGAPEQAFTVKCDLENNPDESRADGRLIVDIGVAPTRPMEFIFFRLGHRRDMTKVTEASA